MTGTYDPEEKRNIHAVLELGTLCQHNFGHNAIVGALSIMPAYNGHFFQQKENDYEKNTYCHNCTEKFLPPSAFSED